jgi:hypothetical protein
MTDAERQRARRDRLRQAKGPTPAKQAAKAAPPPASQPIDAAPLSISAQEKLQAAIRQHQRRLDAEFEQRVLADIKRRIDEIVLPSYREEAEMHDLIIKRRKGVFPKETYRLILSMLHPDSFKSASEERRNEAFNAFKGAEILLLDEKQRPTTASNLPSSFAEMMERKRKVAEGRKAKQRR